MWVDALPRHKLKKLCGDGYFLLTHLCYFSAIRFKPESILSPYYFRFLLLLKPAQNIRLYLNDIHIVE